MAYDAQAAQRLAVSVAQGFVESLRALAARAAPPSELALEAEALAVRSGEAFEQGLDELLAAVRAEVQATQQRLDRDQRALTEVFERLRAERARVEQDVQQLGREREQLEAQRLESESRRHPWPQAREDERQRVDEERARLAQERSDIASSREELEAEWQRYRTQVRKLTDKEHEFEHEQSALTRDLQALVGNQEKLHRERDQFIEDMRKLNASTDPERRKKERLELAQEAEQLRNQREAIESKRLELSVESRRLNSDLAELNDERQILRKESGKLAEAKAQLDEDRQGCEELQHNLREQQQKLQTDRKQLEQETREVRVRRNQVDGEAHRLAEAELQVAERHRSAAEQQECVRQELRKVSESWDKLEERQRSLALDQSLFEEEKLKLTEKADELDEARARVRAEQTHLASEHAKFNDEKWRAVCPVESLVPDVMANGKCVSWAARPLIRPLDRCKDLPLCTEDCVKDLSCPFNRFASHVVAAPSPKFIEAEEVARRIVASPHEANVVIRKVSPTRVITLNVAGEAVVSVPKDVLMQCRGSMLADRFGGSVDLGKGSDGHVFVDFAPEIFLPMLEHLRNRHSETPERLAPPPEISGDASVVRRFRDMLRYYGMLEWVYRAVPLSPSLCLQVGINHISCLPSEFAATVTKNGESAPLTGEGIVTLPIGWEVMSAAAEDFSVVVGQILLRFQGASRLVVANARGGFDAYHTSTLSTTSARAWGSAARRVDEDVDLVEAVGVAGDSCKCFKLGAHGVALVICARSQSIMAGAAMQEPSSQG